MAFEDEIESAIKGGLDHFNQYILKQTNANENYLIQHFRLKDGTQSTLLNYLISQHQEAEEEAESKVRKRDLTPFIDRIIVASPNVNVGQPLHLAVEQKKAKLALHIFSLEKMANSPVDNKTVHTHPSENRLSQASFDSFNGVRKLIFDVSTRDIHGRTLLSLVLSLLHLDLLMELILRLPDVNAPSYLSNDKFPSQPLHQAITLDFAAGVKSLADKGAALANPFGDMNETPLLLACRLGSINALETLLTYPVEQLSLETENNHIVDDRKVGCTAIEELCIHISEGKDSEETLRGVAMLLCHGAEAPRNEQMWHHLTYHRTKIMNFVWEYLKDKPTLVDNFVNRCHLKDGPLHHIFYGKNTWDNSWRHFFGRPCEVANIIENLILRKHAPQSKETKEESSDASNSLANLREVKDPSLLYAEFVRRYKLAYDNKWFPNRWSAMRWMISEGHADWKSVEQYSHLNPSSRTRTIMNDMFRPVPNLHEDLNKEQATSPSPK